MLINSTIGWGLCVVYRTNSVSSADVLGHPFGKVPCPRAFDGSPDEAKVILSDPANPVGKEMLASKSLMVKCYLP